MTIYFAQRSVEFSKSKSLFFSMAFSGLRSSDFRYPSHFSMGKKIAHAKVHFLDLFEIQTATVFEVQIGPSSRWVPNSFVDVYPDLSTGDVESQGVLSKLKEN
jgi:hypothetical protein